MTRRSLLIGFCLGLCLVACDAGEIVVFSAEQAGSAGVMNVAGAGAGGALEPGGAPAMGGGGGTSGGTVGIASAGQSSAGSAGAVGTPCHTSADCDPLWLCAKNSCADEAGVCVARPALPDSTTALVCGCDHITYWNDALRQWYGISASTPGQCVSGARACQMDTDCGAGATCSHLLPPMTSCSSPGPGTCWVTPADCPTGDRPRWSLCPPPGGGSGGGQPPACATICQAVQSGCSYMQVPRGEPCP